MPHGSYIYATESDTANAAVCIYPQSEHSLPHWKCLLRRCADCPFINITDQETTKKHDKTTPSIRFHIYHITGCFLVYIFVDLSGKYPCLHM